MPRNREADNFVVIHLDRNGNLINHKTSNQPVQSLVSINSSSTDYSRPTRVKRTAVYERENYKYDQEHRSTILVPPRRRHQETHIETAPRRRRLRYVPPKSNVQIFDERLDWHGKPKIDSHNERSLDRLRTERRPIIFNESHASSSHARTNRYNDDYVQYKQRERSLRHQEPYVINAPPERRLKAERVQMDNYDDEYDAYSRRPKPRRLPPMEYQKFPWQGQARPKQRGNDYMNRIRQQRSISPALRRKPRWNYIQAKTDSYNDDYMELLRDQSRPRIVNHLPRWRSEPKISSYNDSYHSPRFHSRPRIFNQKPRWNAQAKIDSGFESNAYDI